MSSITTRIFGGLGNQMFVYAAARGISLRTGAPLYLDTVSGFLRDAYKREWSLHHFQVDHKPAGQWRSFTFPGGRAVRKVIKILNQKGLLHNYCLEKDYEYFDPAVFNLQPDGPVWIEGYWQSAKYFEDVADQIRADLTLKTPLSSAAAEMLQNIQSTQAIGLHARRLRNILVGEDNAKIKTLQLNFYEKAIEQIGKQVKNPHFYCFSDAPDWLEANLNIPYPSTFVTFNEGRDDRNYEDFHLLSQCKHFVISNSTYAWWAAWLGNNPEKKVLAPGLEFWDCKDILPADWQIIPS